MIFDVRSTSDGGFTARQSQQTPAVYLDFCALRAIADQPELADRFIRAMRRASASLLISSFTIYEFSILNDTKHAIAVDALLRQVFRHLYFIQCEPFTVITREDAMHNAPHADAEMFRQTLTLISQQQEEFELASIFSSGSAELRPVLVDFTRNVQQAFRTLQGRLIGDESIRRTADNAFSMIGNRRTATAALLAAVVKTLHDDRLPTGNDTIDLMHTIVPSAYADLVVLDGKWATAVSQGTTRMHKQGYSAPVARAFSMRGAGIEEFLTTLETWPASSNS